MLLCTSNVLGFLSVVFLSHPIVSMDTQGRVLTANAATLRLYQKRFGRPLEMGQHLVDPANPYLMKPWQPRMDQGHCPGAPVAPLHSRLHDQGSGPRLRAPPP